MTTHATPPPQMPVLGPPGEQCLQCGATLAEDQRYCVNCGRRRAQARVDYRALLPDSGPPASEPHAATTTATAGLPEAVPPTSESRSVSPLGAAVAIGLLLLAVLLGAVLGSNGDGGKSPAPVIVGGGATATQTPTTDEWSGGNGFTVQLQTLPKASTRPAQVAQAKSAAQAKGAPDVGVLDSDSYPSLPPGNYVVYSGHYASQGAADAALKGLSAKFPDATAVEVSKTVSASGSGSGGSSSGSAGASGSSSAPAPSSSTKSAPSKSTQDYVQKSKKIPDTVGTGGKAPKTDNAAPGGGSGGGTSIG